MFGLSWTQIMVIVIIGVFLLGPERIPVAVKWLTSSLRKAREMAQGAQDQLNSQMGPEIAEMRRQIAELQSLKELKELKELRELHPRKLLGKGLLGTDAPEPTGVADLLGIDKNLLDPIKKAVSEPEPAPPTTAAAAAPKADLSKAAAPAVAAAAAASMVKPVSPNGPSTVVIPDPLPLPDRPAAAVDALPSPGEEGAVDEGAADAPDPVTPEPGEVVVDPVTPEVVPSVPPIATAGPESGSAAAAVDPVLAEPVLAEPVLADADPLPTVDRSDPEPTLWSPDPAASEPRSAADPLPVPDRR